VVSLPCAGGTQRYLVGTDVKSRYGFVEINFDSQNRLSYQYYDSLGQAQSDRDLPNRITLDRSGKVDYLKRAAGQIPLR
jgi:hypothetical protein